MWPFTKTPADPASLIERAQQRISSGNLAGAATDLESAFAALEKTSGIREKGLAVVAARLLSTVYFDSGDAMRGLERGRQAITLGKQVLGTLHDAIAKAQRAGAADAVARMGELANDACDHVISDLTNLASFELEYDMTSGAVDHFREAIALADASGTTSFEADRARVKLGLLLAKTERFEEARPLLDAAWTRLLGSIPQEPEECLETLQLLSDIARAFEAGGHDLGRKDVVADAEQRHEKLVALKKEKLGATDPEVALSLGHLSYLHARAGRPDEAQKFHDRALAVWTELAKKKGLPPDHPVLAGTREMLAAMKTGALAP